MEEPMWSKAGKKHNLEHFREIIFKLISSDLRELKWNIHDMNSSIKNNNHKSIWTLY